MAAAACGFLITILLANGKNKIQRKGIAIQISLIIQMVLTIAACENREFLEETLGKLRYSSFATLLLNNTRKHFKAIGNTFTNMCRLYFERLNETIEKY